jgi:putative effector of murein hydrolase
MLNEFIWISLTLAIYFLCRRLYLRYPYALLNPVLWATLILIGCVTALHHPTASYQAATHPLVWLLGPAVVAMALPVWQKRQLILEHWSMFAVVVGASLVLAGATSHLLGWVLPPEMARALAVKSVTAPVALGIGQEIGLRTDLVVTGVMTSGLFGMLLGPSLLALAGLRGDSAVVGAALGCASHGLGTARAFEIGRTAGAFASVSMGLCALAYGVVAPFFV